VSGVPHVNSPRAVHNTYRDRMIAVLDEANVSFIRSHLVSTAERPEAGPLPVWAWAAIAGGATAVLYLRGRAGAASDQTQAPSTTGPFSAPVIVTREAMSSDSSAPLAPTTPSVPPRPNWQFGSPPADKSKWVWHLTDVGASAYQRSTNQPWPGGVYPGTADPGNVIAGFGAGNYSWQWTIVPEGYTSTTYAAALGGAGMGGGGGPNAVMMAPGAGRVMRFVSPHAHPQYVRTGMGGGGPAGLRSVARQTGLPEIRLMALNPGQWRGGKPPSHIHIR